MNYHAAKVTILHILQGMQINATRAQDEEERAQYQAIADLMAVALETIEKMENKAKGVSER